MLDKRVVVAFPRLSNAQFCPLYVIKNELPEVGLECTCACTCTCIYIHCIERPYYIGQGFSMILYITISFFLNNILLHVQYMYTCIYMYSTCTCIYIHVHVHIERPYYIGQGFSMNVYMYTIVSLLPL